VYDVGEEDQRLVLYALLLAEAQREDLERFVHGDSLVSMWPRLRRLLGPHARLGVGATADGTGLPVSLVGLPPAHWQVLLDGLPVFDQYGLLLAGGYAFRAHEILHRPSQDLDFAEHVRVAFQAAGYGVRLIEATGRYARLALRLPGFGDELEMDLLKEALEPRWVSVQLGPAASVRALSLDDIVGLQSARLA
jgi:hypothetical protein